MGDLNAKLGKISPLDESLHTNINNHIGRYAVGTRNSNGEHILNFLCEKDLFAGNTAFPHKCRHITTWTGWLKDHSKPGNCTYAVHTQIDFILCSTRSKGVLTNARAYAGAKLHSDHKIVMAHLDLGKPYLTHLRKPRRIVYNISRLTSDKDIQCSYQTNLDSNIHQLDLTTSTSPAEKLDMMLTTIKSTAVNIVGTMNHKHRADYSNDSQVVTLVEKRKQLRLQLNTNSSSDKSSVRSLINRTQKCIQARLTAPS